MKAGDYCWDASYVPYKIKNRRGEYLYLHGRSQVARTEHMIDWVSVGEQVMWLPISNNWQLATVLDRPSLWVRLERNGAEHKITWAKVLKVDFKRDWDAPKGDQMVTYFERGELTAGNEQLDLI